MLKTGIPQYSVYGIDEDFFQENEGGLSLEAQAILHCYGYRESNYARDEHLDQVEWALGNRRPEAVHEHLDDEVARHHHQGARNIAFCSFDHCGEDDLIVQNNLRRFFLIWCDARSPKFLSTRQVGLYTFFILITPQHICIYLP